MTQDQEPETIDAAAVAAQAALAIPAVAVLARMMRLGWGVYYQAQAELREQLAFAGWDPEHIAQATAELSRAEQQAVRTNGPPTLAELDDTLNTFGRGLVSALRASAEAAPEADEAE